MSYENEIKRLMRELKFAKADEYEAKAAAFDSILKAYDEAFSRERMAGEVSHIIEIYESGESDA